MNFDSYFKFTSYGLVSTAFLALILTGEVDGYSVVLYLIALLLAIFIDYRGVKRLRLREWMWRTMALCYIPFVFLDAAFISNKILALVHMTLFLSAAKLFQDKMDRDWVFLYLISFFQMLLAAGLTFNSVFVGALTLFIFFFVSTLAAFEIKRSGREALKAGEEIIRREVVKDAPERKKASRDGGARYAGEQKKSSRIRYLMGASSSQLAMVALLTLPLFFLIPRSAGGGVGGELGNYQALTGFSERVDLGDVSRLKTSSQVVMRVKLDRSPGKFLKWRGVALDYYDGRSWTFTRGRERETRVDQGGQLNGMLANRNFVRDYSVTSVLAQMAQRTGYPVDMDEDPTPANVLLEGSEQRVHNIVREDVVLEPLNDGVLFAARRLLRVRGTMNWLRIASTRAVSMEPHRIRVEYTAWSDLSEPSEQELRSDTSSQYPENVSRLYLQLPVHGRDVSRMDSRIEQLARKVTEGASTPYDKALAIQNYLKTNFTYTLDVTPTAGDPLAEFLFDTHAGFCEYFASAMVIMLRTLDIPARVVNGFQMGEYNNISDFYTIREHDAHSWVEVYFPGYKTWVEFDPTPSAGINDYSHGGLAAKVRQIMDAAEVFWMDYVVTLDRNQQASIMVAIQYRLRAIREGIITAYQSFKYWLLRHIRDLVSDSQWKSTRIIGLVLQLVLTVLILITGYIAWSYLRTRRLPHSGRVPWWRRLFILPTWRRRRDPRLSALMFYEQMLGILALHGISKLPDQTPLEFAEAHGGIIQVRQVTEIYNKIRFGGATLDEPGKQNVGKLLSEIRQSLRGRRRPALGGRKKTFKS